MDLSRDYRRHPGEGLPHAPKVKGMVSQWITHAGTKLNVGFTWGRSSTVDFIGSTLSQRVVRGSGDKVAGVILLLCHALGPLSGA
jgi:hypothetical protein